MSGIQIGARGKSRQSPMVMIVMAIRAEYLWCEQEGAWTGMTTVHASDFTVLPRPTPLYEAERDDGVIVRTIEYTPAVAAAVLAAQIEVAA